MEIDAEAPAVARNDVVVAAPIDAVWAILADVERWPRWNAEIKSAAIAGPPAAGAQFRWKAGPGTIRSTITRVERPQLLAWTGRTLGISAIHVWRLEAQADGTHVRTEESMEGLTVRLLRGSIQKNLEKSLETWLQSLRTEAERRWTLGDRAGQGGEAHTV